MDGPRTVASAASPRERRDTRELAIDLVSRWSGPAIVAACCIFAFVQLQPHLLFLDTTAAGGDMGAHVWFPAYLRDHLLPSGRLAGWSPDFYAGFPAGQFYFPFPALLTVLLDVAIPYNVAFKLVTALGPVLVPAGAYWFGRGIRAPRPGPALLAVGATAFLFFEGYGDATQVFDHRIMGGTVLSTLAGEYSFTIALGLALFFLGSFARALDGRGSTWLPALLLAGTVTSHLVVTVFALYAAGVLWMLRKPWRTAGKATAIVAVSGLLTAVWSLPLLATLGQTTDMRYEPIDHYLRWMFLGTHFTLLYALVLAALVLGAVHRRPSTRDLFLIAVVAAGVFCGWELLRDVLGKAPAWNLRLLPFWYLSLYLLAGLGAAELVRLAARGVVWVAYGAAPRTAVEGPAPDEPEQVVVSSDDHRTRTRLVQVVAGASLALLVTAGTLVWVNESRQNLPYWAQYNYTGFEGGSATDVPVTAKSWPEYQRFIDTVAALPPGRLLWEGGSSLDAYGTTLALMLLPYWTDGRISSMEGLYYESSGTTPYHFMTSATLTLAPSNPVRGLPYRSIATDFDLGVRYLQDLGVRYYAAMSPEAKQRADANPALRAVATVPDLDEKAPSGWVIYEVAGAALVKALTNEPVVVDGMRADPDWRCEGRPPPPPDSGRTPEFSPWECTAVPWFDDPEALDRPLTDGGPASWRHASPGSARAVAQRPLPHVRVSRVRSGDDFVEFDVSRPGVPVMVRTSYFPNWKVEGARGPWRATPNFMVVVPTSRHVRLEYGTTAAEWLGRVGSLVGLFGLAGLVWWDLARRSERSVGGVRRRPTVRFRIRSRD